MKFAPCILVGLSLLVLSGCVVEAESEDSCYSRMTQELVSNVRELEKLMYYHPDTPQLTGLDYAEEASRVDRENLLLFKMYTSKDINVCDYFVFNSRLMKKD